MISVRSYCLAALLVVGSIGAARAADAAAPYEWKNVAIGGGGFVTGVTFHPREKGLAYARTDVGGAYRWDDKLQRWIALTDWLGPEDDNLMGIESIAIDPSDPERLYLAAGTYLNAKVGNGAILRSSDRGRTFQRTNLPFKLGGNEMGRGNGERLAVDPSDGRVVFFGSRNAGLWRSEDGGAVWAPVKSFTNIATSVSAGVQTSWAGLQPVGIVFVVFDPASSQPGRATPKLYAGVSTRDTSLYESNDGGATWIAVPKQPKGLRPNHMVHASDGAFYLSYGDEPGPNTMNNGAVWKYTPTSGEWEDITPAPQSTDTERDGFGWGAVTVDPRNPQVLLATTFCRYEPHDEIFRSTDGGKHWTPLLQHSRFDHSAAAWTRDAYPHWMADIEIDPFDADHAIFVTGYGLWASRNLTTSDRGQGVEWWFKNAGLEETVPLALISPPQGAHLLSGVGDIDGFRHDDVDKPTLQFAGPRLTNTESMAFAGQAPQIVVRSGRIRDRRNNEVRAAWSQDGGTTWQPFANEPPQTSEGAGHITIAADGKRVIWTPVKSGAWITADFGKHWQKVKGVPDGAVIEADKVDEGIYYAFDGATGKLYVSGNGGVEFKEVAGGVGEFGDWFRPEIHPDPQRSAVVYLTASWRGLLRWSAGKLERLAGVEHIESLGLGKPKEGSTAPTLFVAGKVDGKAGLFRSDDDGSSWQRIDDDAHRFGKIWRVTGDPRIHGRVYFAASGRGILYGDPR
ncbi:exo-alpha-sialidase [Lysobacter sp. CFH 32150]|uniref:exo-alpha-sialidase n=1 Tax=Lysobacter sp. CFH 32150 TaxID=2927128 RepID=UPI001FA7643A|nr:exo-alpha-sialidase [Lysobacter sp. CFH 32150]MCI4566364.1 cellulase [Lysobacter sp. CFH 32150]